MKPTFLNLIWGALSLVAFVGMAPPAQAGDRPGIVLAAR